MLNVQLFPVKVITQTTIQQILSRIDIVEIVGGFVRLKKRGVNYLGLCPFHNEKTPSFTVSPTKEIFKCFGCGRSGNAISFLMEHEKYSYVESLRWLANKYNVEVEETEISPELKVFHQIADSLYIINNFAQKYFADILFTNETGRDIGLSYLKERGYREDIITKFQLGYCLPEKDAFAQTALAAKYNIEYLQKAGLVVVRDDKLFDNYRGRIIFPVHNHTGKIIGFGARIIGKNDKAPKYINTPENEIYLKSKILYGSYFARQAIDKNDECLLVEGYTDVISMHQAGIENVVASGGTSLTNDQLRLIKKYTNNLTIIYDGDVAGVKAALRGLDMALEEGLNVKLVLIPDNEDPDSYLNKVGGGRFQEFIKTNKKDVILFQLDVSLKEAGNDSNRKAEVVKQIAETISKIDKIQGFTKRQDYIRRCSEILNIDETGLNFLVNQFIRGEVSKLEKTSQIEDLNYDKNARKADEQDFSDEAYEMLHKDELQEKAFTKVLIQNGLKFLEGTTRVADIMLSELVEEDLFKNKLLYRIIKEYENLFKTGAEPDVKYFVYSIDSDVRSLVVSITNFPFELSKRWKEESTDYALLEQGFKYGAPSYTHKPLTQKEYSIEEEVTSTINYLKLRKIKRLIDQNQQDLQNHQFTDKRTVLIQTHLHLKQIESELTKQLQTVILK